MSPNRSSAATTPTSPVKEDIVEFGRSVIALQKEGLDQLGKALDSRFREAVELLYKSPGRIIVSGMGKSGHIGRKIAATLASTGSSSFFIHPAEAAHGDLGMIQRGDVVLLISNSGETQELMPVIQHVRRLGIPLVAISSGGGSSLLRSADVPLALPPASEACPVGIAPTTSTTMTLVLGDAIAMALMNRRGFTREDFRRLHPGGKLGLRFTPVGDLMHQGDRLPLVDVDLPIADVIVEMTAKSFGVAGVVDPESRLVGVISDGDLRRNINFLSGSSAREIMNPSPKTIAPALMAEDALRLLNENRVTSLFIVEEDGSDRPIGLIHIHDFLRIGLSE